MDNESSNPHNFDMMNSKILIFFLKNHSDFQKNGGKI